MVEARGDVYYSEPTDTTRGTRSFREGPPPRARAQERRLDIAVPSWPRNSRTRRTIRSLSSAAALSVNVNAMMFRGARPAPSARSRCTTRRATTSVFPDPAHAISCRFLPRYSIALRWDAVSGIQPEPSFATLLPSGCPVALKWRCLFTRPALLVHWALVALPHEGTC